MKEEKSGLEEAEKNSTNAGLRNYTRQRGHLYSRDPDVSSEWKEIKENAVPKKRACYSLCFKKIFFASVAFFLHWHLQRHSFFSFQAETLFLARM